MATLIANLTSHCTHGVRCDCGQVHSYIDLIDVISNNGAEKIEMAGYCAREFWKWEQEVAEPALNDLGYRVIDWRSGEQDSFGPLSRVVRVEKDGVYRYMLYR